MTFPWASPFSGMSATGIASLGFLRMPQRRRWRKQPRGCEGNMLRMRCSRAAGVAGSQAVDEWRLVNDSKIIGDDEKGLGMARETLESWKLQLFRLKCGGDTWTTSWNKWSLGLEPGMGGGIPGSKMVLAPTWMISCKSMYHGYLSYWFPVCGQLCHCYSWLYHYIPY